MKKRSVDVCKVVLITSAVWFLLDTFLILYVIDCNRSPVVPQRKEEEQLANKVEDNGIRTVRKTGNKPGPHETVPDVKDKGGGMLARLMRGLRFGSGGPGEMGKAVHIEPQFEAEMKEKFKLNQFNIMASDRIAINRTLPDVRMPQCHKKIYPDDLPPASIIIVFHNEAWSTLLRSIHSVINRSPRKFLTEIILIDDLSDRDYLKDPLDAYIKLLPVPTKIVHMKERSGLIRARLTGADMAQGPVLLFLDAHIEVTIGWLEPLLVRIYDDKTRVAAPIIDVISDDTFEYVTASDMTWGGFNWHLNFRWYPVPPRELDRRNNDRTLPIETPTMAGGLFAIDKQYFYSIGTYDEGMQIWGGENLEISFRVWMCGGSLEIVTCSHVGHIFRKQTPYTFPGGTATVIHHNAARTAEVWMDEYKEFFYRMVPGAKMVAAGDVSMRKRLRKKLRCKSFRWYLEHIYKEAPIPLDYYSIGSIRSPIENMCLDTMGRTEGQKAGLSKCHGMGGNQAWSLTAGGEVRSDETCLAVKGAEASLEKCHKNQRNQLWTFDEEKKQLKHVPTGLCLAAEGDKSAMLTCNSDEERQSWLLENYQSSMHNHLL